MEELESPIVFLLSLAGATIDNDLRSKVTEFGLTLPMWRVLQVLSSDNNQIAKRLAQSTGIEQSTLSRQIAVMKEKGLVLCRKSSSDRRSLEISLTKDGLCLLRRILKVMVDHEQRTFPNIASDDLDRLRTILRAICHSLLS